MDYILLPPPLLGMHFPSALCPGPYLPPSSILALHLLLPSASACVCGCGKGLCADLGLGLLGWHMPTVSWGRKGRHCPCPGTARPRPVLWAASGASCPPAVQYHPHPGRKVVMPWDLPFYMNWAGRCMERGDWFLVPIQGPTFSFCTFCFQFSFPTSYVARASSMWPSWGVLAKH